MIAWLEKYFLPIAAKIGSEKHLVAFRDAFVSIMPITMAGSVAVLLNVFLRDFPNNWGMTGFVEAMQPIIGINGKVWWGTIAMIALVFVFSLGYNLAKAYDLPALPGALVAGSAFIAQMPEVSQVVDFMDGDTLVTGGLWGNINWANTQAAGLFTAMFIGLIASLIYIWVTKANWTIKLPDSVPPAISRAFAAIIPGVIAIYVVGALGWAALTFTGMSINEMISKYVQMPFLGLSQGFISVIITILVVQLLWMFGLHGTNVLGPVLDGVYLPALTANTTAHELGEALPYMWTRASFDAYAWMGGAGCTFALIIAIFIVSKREDMRAVAKLSAPMGVFNINEPVVFGLPIVLNPIYFIPFIFIPVILGLIGYGATAMGLIPPTFVTVPWIMPPVIYAFLATGGNFMAALVALVNLVIGIVLYIPFVAMANKTNIE